MFKRLLQGIFLVSGTLLPLADAAAQQLLGSYSFTGAQGSEPVWAVDQPAQANFSPMRRGNGVTPAPRANAFGATGWTSAAACNLNQYYGFTVSAQPGAVLNMLTLGLTEQRDYGSVHQLQVRSSLDGFQQPLLNARLLDSLGTSSWSVVLDSAFRSVQSVEFRIYGFDSDTIYSNWSIDNVYLVGYGTNPNAHGGTVQFGAASQVVSEGARFVQVPVDLTNAGTLSTNARVRVAGGTATAGADYTFTSQNLYWAAGQSTTRVLMIPVVDDNLVELPETIQLVLDNAALGTTIGAGSTYTITIVDNDSTSGPGPATLEFVGQGTAVQEGQMAAVPLRLTLPQALTSPHTVRVRSWSQTATVGVDYYNLDTLIYIPAMPAGVHNLGTVLITKDDTQQEATEYVTVYFDSTGSTLPAQLMGSYTVAIIDNDSTGNPANQATVAFGTAQQWVSEGAGQIRIPVTLTNRNFLATTAVEVRLAIPSGTATDGADYIFSTQTLSFPAGTAATRDVLLSIVDDTLTEMPESVILELANVSGGVIGQPGSITIMIADNDSTGYPIDSVQRVTQNNAQGVATYLGRTVRLRGVVTSNNLNTSGYMSALQDATGGISLMRPANATGPNPVEGDEIEVVGTIAQDRGLTQLVVASYQVLQRGQLLPSPRIVNTLDESTESELVWLQSGYSLVNPAQWTNNPAGFTVDITNGSQTLAMRIAPGTDLVNSAAPGGVFGLMGLGTQVAGTTTAPFLDGYAITPRSSADLQRPTGLSVEAAGATFSLFPNPAADRITVQTAQSGAATVVDATGRVVLTASLQAGATELPVQALRPGLYVVRVGQATQRFVKQ